MQKQKIVGRPKSKNPVSVRFTVCLDKETSGKLDDYCAAENVTKSVAVRRGLSLLWARKKKE